MSERIRERTLAKKTSPNALNKATFIALRADITQALADGFAVKTIWETLTDEGKVGFSYQTFRKFVNRLIKPEELELPKSETVPSPSNPGSSPKMPGFTFDPKPKKDDLI